MPPAPARQRRLVVLGILAGLVIAGALAWQLLKKPTVNDLVKDGEREYERGVAALQAKDGPGAVAAFDKAIAKADEALAKLEDAQKAGKVKAGEEQVFEASRGFAYWLKARSIRDRAFGKAVADGKPIPESFDTTTKETYRAFGAIPDEAAQGSAFAAFDQAAARIGRDPNVARAYLRILLTQTGIRWALVGDMARATLESSPDDTRAHYLLARIDFEQFDDKNQPIPADNRDPDRVARAAQALAASKKSGEFPLWRTLDLEAKILRWQITHPRPGFDAATEKARLRSLLFDPKTGALTRAAAGEAFDALSRFDVTGIMDLHRMAVELAIEDKDSATIAAALKATLAVGRTLAEHRSGQAQAGEISEYVTATAALARPAVAPADWSGLLKALNATAKAAAAKKTWWAGASVRLAEFHAAAGDAASAEAWYTEAAAWPKMPTAMKVDIHSRLLDLLTARGADPAVSLAALAGDSSPKALAVRTFHAGAAAERAGKLAEAFVKFTESANADPGGEYAARGLAAVPGLALALNRPGDVMSWARALDTDWNAIAKLDPASQKWVAAHVANRDEAIALGVVGQARGLRQRLLERKDKSKVSTDDLGRLARAVEAGLKRVAPSGPAAVAIRVAQAEALIAAGQTADAKAALDPVRAAAPAAALRVEFPDVAARTAADDQAKAVGGLFWAEWLASTGRGPAAAVELERAGQSALAALVKGMDATAAAALIRAVAAAEDPNALTAEQSTGRQAKAAVALFGQGTGAEAAKAFEMLSEVAELKAMAAAGKQAAEAKKG